jgi:glutamate-ammonia-ligase adenylyltransferase
MTLMIKDLISKETGTEAELSALGFDNPALALTNLRIVQKGPLGECLDLVSEAALASPSPAGALNNLERVAAVLDADTLAGLGRDPDGLRRLISICGSSPFLSNILVLRPELFDRLFVEGGLSAAGSPESFAGELTGPTTEAEGFDAMARELRLFKQKEFLRIGARDLLGIADVRETTREISDIASATLDAAVAFASRELKETYGAPVFTDDDGAEREAAFTVIGLGKLGGRELNFSSDIDILYVYSSDNGRTIGRGREGGTPEEIEASQLSLHAYFVKLSTMVTRLISLPTADG